MGLMELLSRHLISYATDEKWLHDIMDPKKRNRSHLYKKAMIHYILTAGDPEFNNIVIPGDKVKTVTPNQKYLITQSIVQQKQESPDDLIPEADPFLIVADASEIGDIMGGLK